MDFCALDYDAFTRTHAPDAENLFKRTLSYYNGGDTIRALKGLFEILERFLPRTQARLGKERTKSAPALNYLHANYAAPVAVGTLSGLCAMSESRFYSAFRAITGQSPIEYKNSLKINHAVRLVEQGVTLEEICDELNFASPAFLRKMIKRQTGLLPKEIKRNKMKM